MRTGGARVPPPLQGQNERALQPRAWLGVQPTGRRARRRDERSSRGLSRFLLSLDVGEACCLPGRNG